MTIYRVCVCERYMEGPHDSGNIAASHHVLRETCIPYYLCLSSCCCVCPMQTYYVSSNQEMLPVEVIQVWEKAVLLQRLRQGWLVN